jgi:hypothetical protein
LIPGGAELFLLVAASISIVRPRELPLHRAPGFLQVYEATEVCNLPLGCI